MISRIVRPSDALRWLDSFVMKLSNSVNASTGFVIGFVLGLLFFHDKGEAWWATVVPAAVLGIAGGFVGYILARDAEKKRADKR